MLISLSILGQTGPRLEFREQQPAIGRTLDLDCRLLYAAPTNYTPTVENLHMRQSRASGDRVTSASHSRPVAAHRSQVDVPTAMAVLFVDIPVPRSCIRSSTPLTAHFPAGFSIAGAAVPGTATSAEDHQKSMLRVCTANFRGRASYVPPTGLSRCRGSNRSIPTQTTRERG